MCGYARKHPNKRILAVDVCPQANFSELLLGGLVNSGSDHLLQIQGQVPRATIGGYFQLRLPAPYAPPPFNASDYLTTPHQKNSQIPRNIRLFCGDPLLELQSNAMSTLANNQIPGTNTWIAIIDWLSDFLSQLEDEIDVVFIDTNPSFSIYTQIALSSADRIVLPVMADDSSRRAIQNAFSLIYGLKLPSEIYLEYAFTKKLANANRGLPKVHLVLKNRITQYMGPASAYSAVLEEIEAELESLLVSHPEIFTFSSVKDGVEEIRDFQTTGVVAFAKGTPFYSLPSGRLNINGKRVRVNEPYRLNCVKNIQEVVNKL
jgi:cellulose biosynthesis protein BcsQ